MNYNPYKLLDDILECYKDDGTGNYRMKLKSDEIIEIIRDKPAYKSKMFQGALDQLNDDGYLKFEPVSIWNDYFQKHIDLDAYRLTFKGMLLIGNGNYSKMITDEKNENETVLALQVSYEKQGEVLNRLTKWIAFATVPMGIYAIYQILQAFFCLLGLLCNCK